MLGAGIAQSVGRPGFDSRREQVICLYSTGSRPVLGPIQISIQCVPGAFLAGLKRPGSEADHSPPSSAEVVNYGAISPLPYSSSWRVNYLYTGNCWEQRTQTDILMVFLRAHALRCLRKMLRVSKIEIWVPVVVVSTSRTRRVLDWSNNGMANPNHAWGIMWAHARFSVLICPVYTGAYNATILCTNSSAKYVTGQLFQN
jgi:hypothetical protein